MKPALTPEEWHTAQLWNAGKLPGGIVRGYGMFNPAASAEKKHGLAALCLYGQPFGFTWADVDWLQWIHDKTLGSDESLERCAALIERIKALLPPRDDAKGSEP